MHTSVHESFYRQREFDRVLQVAPFCQKTDRYECNNKGHVTPTEIKFISNQ